MEQGLLAGGEAVLLVSVEQGLMRCVTAELCKEGRCSQQRAALCAAMEGCERSANGDELTLTNSETKQTQEILPRPPCHLHLLRNPSGTAIFSFCLVNVSYLQENRQRSHSSAQRDSIWVESAMDVLPSPL